MQNGLPRVIGRRARPAFTIVEMLVVMGIVAALAGILLPSVARAHGAAQRTQSTSNLRTVAFAHEQYAIDCKDRHFTLMRGDLSSYGDSFDAAASAYAAAGGRPLRPVGLGWGPRLVGQGLQHWVITSATRPPLIFGGGLDSFGAFRMTNGEAFHDYVGGRFYDPVYYAPADDVIYPTVEPGFESPHPFTPVLLPQLTWSTYCFSAAAMFHPSVFRRPSEGGWQSPWSLDGGFRPPGLSQARYPDLKTALLEHHWLQNRRGPSCHAAFVATESCQPYFFNGGIESVPFAACFDGHVAAVPVRHAMDSDSRVRHQSGGADGLWSRGTPWGEDGYLQQYAYDQAATSFHVLTTDGIRGRDFLSD